VVEKLLKELWMINKKFLVGWGRQIQRRCRSISAGLNGQSGRSVRSGQTLIEVLIATGVVGLVITAAAAGLTFSVKNTAEAKYRALAAYQAQEVVEMLRRERILLGWDSFVAELQTGTPYCLNTLPTTTTQYEALIQGACSSGIPVAGTEFKRELAVSAKNASSIKFTVNITWTDGAMTRTYPLVQEFQEWN
jgi:type II secretory pathway pseudopilin PulG